ncbi:26S proteasome non-ATPase regulatory subunit 8 [Dioszegia hungarica]|uniref:26S proteasome non-ATPase regulatory subunit 8 n=1 Tax=Dioszegia hungarica TaxID=4972 RepID=A0AA38HFU8_9TREE|nr:26S proteasome non-ATPase regulatory subunit 8 [Dioszegia hungarica]KAI9638366.1 26S proteasome non-ATPase regulatory subunit 8 [Dioszegia hungarica]
MSLQQSLTELQSAFDKGKTEQVTSQLSKLKLELAKSGLYFAPPTATSNDLVVARSILELASFHSLRLHSLKSYTAYNAALQPFYALPNLPSSPNRPVILGLYLLALLSGGQLTEFHTLLERLGPGEMGDSFVKLPVDLERWLMEGAYNKVYRARERVPREEFGFLLEKLMGTVRAQIAATIEASYPSLGKQNASGLLFFKSGEEKDLIEFTSSRKWTLNPSTSTFTFPSTSPDDTPTYNTSANPSATSFGATGNSMSGGVTRGIPMRTMVGPALRLAQQLEAIV